MRCPENASFANRSTQGKALTSTQEPFATRQHPAPIEPDGLRSRGGENVVTNFQFRLNGIIITHLKVRPAAIDGATDHWELVACHDTLGEFTIDDNDGLADPALTRFVLEVRDVTIPPIERRYLPNKGWRQVTTSECLALLESVGIDTPLR
jgi:hypothetical protein